MCILYDVVTNTAAGTAFIAKWHQVKGGRISAALKPDMDCETSQ